SCPQVAGARILGLMDRANGNSSETNRLLQRVDAGDQEALGALLAHHRERLGCMIAVRLDHRFQGRIDPSDVLQEAFLQASLHLGQSLQQPALPFLLWLRLLTGQKLVALHPHHLKTRLRDASRELSLDRAALPEASSAALAAQLLGREVTPSEAAVRAEMRLRLQQALND